LQDCFDLAHNDFNVFRSDKSGAARKFRLASS
jgi:hypothetical protein